MFVLQKRFYLSLFDKLNRGGRGSFKSSWKKKLLKGGFGTLWEKEIKTFLRTPAQWSQLLVIGALVVIFVLNLKMIPLPHPAVKNMVVYLNLALTVFIIAGLNSRFTFPSIPVEGHGLVHLVASPFGRRTFYDFKLIVHLFPQLVLALLLLWIGDLTLGFDPFTRLVGLVFTLPLVTLLTVLALYFGVHSREIAALSPQHALLSRSGIAYMLWSMITIAACLGLLARPVFLYYYMVFLRRPVPHIEIGLWLGGLVLLNGLAAWLFYSRGKKLWLQREF